MLLSKQSMDGDSMKKDRKAVTFLKQKSYLLAACLMLAAVLGMTGVYISEQRKEQTKLEQQAKEKARQNELAKEEEPQTTAVDRIIQPQNDDFLDAPDAIASESKTSSKKKEAEKEKETEEKEEAKEEETKEEQADSTEQTVEESSAEVSMVSTQPELHFDAAAEMGWPLQGNVIMNYSKDQTIYFATLNQYKTNEALIIQGNVNDKVSSVADGVISNIEYNNAETGCTVTVDLGDGYSAVYGQLKEVPLSAGDYVEAGATIGYVSEPTKYYSMEGPNLYFQMIKDNETIDPMEFLQ